MRSRGFTLIELIVVVVILGVLVTTIVTNLDFLTPKHRLRAAARKLASILELLRYRAASDGLPYKMIYDLRNSEYWVKTPEKIEDKGETKVKIESQKVFWTSLDEEIKIKDVTTCDGSIVEGGKVTVYISPTGTATRHIVHLINEKNMQISITLNPFTGDARTAEGYEKLKQYEELKDEGDYDY